MRKGTIINRIKSNRGSFSAVLLFAIFLGVLCVIAFLWIQENRPLDPPEETAKETRGYITISLTKAAETKPAETAAEINSQNALEEQAQLAAIEAQRAAAAAQASLEAALAEANRIAAEAEAARIVAEAAQKAAEAEAEQKAAEAEAAKKAAEEEAARRAAEEAARKAAEEEAAKKAAEETQAPVKVLGNTKVLDTKEHIMHSPRCELVNSRAEEDKQIVEAGIFELQVKGYQMCEKCLAGLTDTDTVTIDELPKISLSDL